MFEDEFRETNRRSTKVEFLVADASLLLPPTGTPLTGIDFAKRLPCGEVERARRSLRTFFLLRDLSLVVQGIDETRLPLNNTEPCISVQDVLDLSEKSQLTLSDFHFSSTLVFARFPIQTTLICWP